MSDTRWYLLIRCQPRGGSGSMLDHTIRHTPTSALQQALQEITDELRERSGIGIVPVEANERRIDELSREEDRLREEKWNLYRLNMIANERRDLIGDNPR